LLDDINDNVVAIVAAINADLIANGILNSNASSNGLAVQSGLGIQWSLTISTNSTFTTNQTLAIEISIQNTLVIEIGCNINLIHVNLYLNGKRSEEVKYTHSYNTQVHIYESASSKLFYSFPLLISAILLGLFGH